MEGNLLTWKLPIYRTWRRLDRVHSFPKYVSIEQEPYKVLKLSMGLKEKMKTTLKKGAYLCVIL
jgi:hypothetical protein